MLTRIELSSGEIVIQPKALTQTQNFDSLPNVRELQSSRKKLETRNPFTKGIQSNTESITTEHRTWEDAISDVAKFQFYLYDGWVPELNSWPKISLANLSESGQLQLR